MKIPISIKKPIKKVYYFVRGLFKVNNLFIFLDILIPKRDNYWIFPVYFVGTGNLGDNMLAVYEAVKYDPNIKKIILIKEKEQVIDGGRNVLVLRMMSMRAGWYLMRSKIIFVQHSIWLDLSKSLYQMIFPWRRHIVNLWHGIVIKDLTHPSSGILNSRSKKEMKKYKIICSSESDLKIMKKSFPITDTNNFWLTGLPRNDFLVMDYSQLPKKYKDELEILKSKLNGKSLIIYTPTYRELNLGGYYYSFSKNEIDELKSYLLETNAIMGVRYHSYLQPDFICDLVDDEFIIDLSSGVVSDVRMLIREAEIIITDYSSIYIDAIYLQKKLISFAYDLEHYLSIQRGFYYDFEEVFPGKICHTFDELILSLKHYKRSLSSSEKEKYVEISKLFFKYYDSENTARVVEKVTELTGKQTKLRNQKI